MQRNMYHERRRMEGGKHADRFQEKSVARKNDFTYNKNFEPTMNRPRHRDYEKRHHEYMRSASEGRGRGTFKHAVSKNNIQIRRGIYPFQRNYEGDIKYSDPRTAGIHPNRRPRENSQSSCDRGYWIPPKEKYEPINNQRCSTFPDTSQRDFQNPMQQKRWKFSHDFHTKRKFYHDDKFKGRNNCDHYAHQKIQQRRPSFHGNLGIKPEPLCETSSDGTKSESLSCGAQTKVYSLSPDHTVEGHSPENMGFGDFDEKMVKEEQDFLEKNSEKDCLKQDNMEHNVPEERAIENQETSKQGCDEQEQKVANYPLDLLKDFPLDLRFSRHGHADRLLQQNVSPKFPTVRENDQNNNKLKQPHMPRYNPRIQKQGIQRGHISEAIVKEQFQLSRNEDTLMQSTTPAWCSPPEVVINKMDSTEETSLDKYCSSTGVDFQGNSVVYTQESLGKLDENSTMYVTRKESIVNDSPRGSTERSNSYAAGDPRLRSKPADCMTIKCNQTMVGSSSNISSLSKTQHSYTRIGIKSQPVPQRRQLKKSKPKLTINEVMEKYAVSVSVYGLRWVMDLLSVDDEALEQRENEAISKDPDPSGWCVPHEGLRACQQQRKNLIARRAAFSKFTEEYHNSQGRRPFSMESSKACHNEHKFK